MFLIKTVVKVALSTILILNSVLALLFAVVNPEALVLATKISGTGAVLYQLVNAILGMIVAYVLLREHKRGAYLCILFLGFHFVEVLISNISTFHVLSFSPLYSVGVALTMFQLIINRYK